MESWGQSPNCSGLPKTEAEESNWRKHVQITLRNFADKSNREMGQ